MIFLLLGILALAIGGCVCVVWAERGGPRWVRVVAIIMRTAGELLSSSTQQSRRRRSSSSSDD
ncbi:hypothetical protein [Streptomyces sp. NRRL S-1022]|uniref:hypothetical protein n=1 Tax=Streptomyces sp. NRRL S-1022 TaxID=1463880 RepID=UPI0004BEE0CF|nr:hypothetical protein [Streptomyces sp. NRRL S-1022]